MLLLSGCSAFDVANLAAPDDGYTEHRDIPYGDLPRQQMDLYLPDATLRKQVTLVFFYGGGWRDGSRSQYRFVGRRLAARGYTVILPDYRLYPEVTFPDFVDDAASAVVALQGPVSRDHEISGPLFLMGHSAGAHIAMLLALDQRYLAAVGSASDSLAGVIGISGPYDFRPFTSDFMFDVFPGEEAQAASQPVNFAGGDDPPVLLLHGDADKRVWTRNSKRLHARLLGEEADSTLVLYPGISHAGILFPLVGIESEENTLLEDIDRFVERAGSTSALPNSQKLSFEAPANLPRYPHRQSMGGGIRTSFPVCFFSRKSACARAISLSG